MNGDFPYKCKYFLQNSNSYSVFSLFVFLFPVGRFSENNQLKITNMPKRHIWGWQILCLTALCPPGLLDAQPQGRREGVGLQNTVALHFRPQLWGRAGSVQSGWNQKRRRLWRGSRTLGGVLSPGVYKSPWGATMKGRSLVPPHPLLIQWIGVETGSLTFHCALQNNSDSSRPLPTLWGPPINKRVKLEVLLENCMHLSLAEWCGKFAVAVHLLSRVRLFATPCSTPGFPVHHQLPELAQTHVRRVSDAFQLSHPPSPSSPSTFNLSLHWDLFKWVSSSHQVAKVL